MDATRSEALEARDLHEGSWAYLSLGESDSRVRPDLHRRVIEVCEERGWPGVSWSSAPRQGYDPVRYARGMSHAVEHADVVIVLLDSDSTVTDAELNSAYVHGRPVVGLSFAGERPQGSAVRAMLSSYGLGRIVQCEDVEECVAGLRAALADPGFIAVIDEAVNEAAGHV